MADTAGDAEDFMAAGGTQHQDGQRDELDQDNDEVVQQALTRDHAERLAALEEDDEGDIDQGDAPLHLNRCREIADVELFDKSGNIAKQFPLSKAGLKKVNVEVDDQKKDFISLQSGVIKGTIQPLPKTIAGVKKYKSDCLKNLLINKSDVLPGEVIAEPMLRLHEVVNGRSKEIADNLKLAMQSGDIEEQRIWKIRQADMCTAIKFNYEASFALYAQHCLTTSCKNLIIKKVEVLENHKRKIRRMLDREERRATSTSLRDIATGEEHERRVRRRAAAESVAQGSVQAAARDEFFLADHDVARTMQDDMESHY